MKPPQPPDDDELKLFSIEEGARIVNVSRSTLYEAIADGECPAHRVGKSRRLRVTRADLATYLERLRHV